MSLGQPPGAGARGPDPLSFWAATSPARILLHWRLDVSAMPPTVEPTAPVVSHRRREPASVGSIIGRYTVLGVLGRGGMGVVLDALDPELDRRVAVKLLHPERAADRGRLRLLREAQAMARLSHPNVVQIYDVGMHAEQVFVAMERIHGETVRQWLQGQARTWREIVDCYLDAARGLMAAHAVGLVHRDFKPDNVLVGDDGRVRVADFGVATLGAPSGGALRSTKPTSEPHEVALTATGAIVGTPRYMAPEQHDGAEVGPAADQFSLCLALHEAVFGQPAFAGDTWPSLRINVAEGRYVEPDEPGRAPRWVANAIRRGLAVAPEDRHPDVAALVDALTRDPAVARRRRVRLGAALGLGAALTSGAFALAIPDSSRCDGGEARVAEVWGGGSGARALEGGGAQAQPLRTRLDDYARRWALAHDESCRTHDRGEVSDGLYDASMRCLQRRLDALERTVELSGTAPLPATLAAAVGLPTVDECTDLDALAADVPLPSSPRAAREVEEVRRRLARAEVLHDAGDIEGAQPELAEVESDAVALEHRPLVAEVSLALARLAMDRMDWGAAMSQLQRAATDAIATGMDRTAAEAVARRIFVTTAMSSDPSTALDDRALAEALLTRAGQPPALDALLANNLGVALWRSDDRPGARERFEHALDVAPRAPSLHPVDRAGMLVNRALLEEDEGRRDELFVQAQRIIETALGDGHIKMLEFGMRWGEHTSDRARARDRLRPVCARLRDTMPAPHVQTHRCFVHLSALQDSLGDPAAALAAIDEALGRLPVEEVQGNDYLMSFVERARGHRALLLGDPQRALSWLADSQKRLQPRAELPWVARNIADGACLEGRALAGLGRRQEASSKLASAIDLYASLAAQSQESLVQIRLDDARVLHRELQRSMGMSKADSQR